MPARKPVQKKKPSRTAWILIGAAALGILLAVGAFSFGATQEEHDTFCASCHTQPESTFFTRTQAGQPVDLASFHSTTKTKTLCIDCHSGSGVSGRVSAELLGARNALAWYTGRAVQPAPLTRPIADESCLKCHSQVSATQDMNNHFHAFLPRWQAADPNAATCVGCHQGHAADGDVQIMYLNRAHTEAVCGACHQALGGGG